MSESLEEKISRSRLMLRNPYAYSDGVGGYDAAPKQDGLGRRISASRLRLENPYAYLDGEDGYDAVAAGEGKDNPPFELKIEDIRPSGLVGKRLSFEKIEEIAKRLQTSIWTNRQAIWRDNTPNDPVDVLDPKLAFTTIGYSFEGGKPLGEMLTNEGPVEVAGIIERSRRHAAVSSQVPVTMRQFTAAHELGHALLHRAEGLHRDRGVDGSRIAGAREQIEVEADKFATYFLMPAKLLVSEFKARFAVTPFAINDETAFALTADSSDNLRMSVKNTRGLSRVLASADQFDGKSFKSLAERFRVSNEAMAIRLEELGLLDF